MTKEDLQAMIKEAVGAELAEHAEASRLAAEAAAATIQRAYVPNGIAQAVPGTPGRVATLNDLKSIYPGADGPGVKFARIGRAMAVAEADKKTLKEVLEAWGSGEMAEEYFAETKAYEARTKALGYATIAGGGALVPPPYTNELIPLLTAKSVVRAAGAQTGPITTYPRETGQGTAYWVGENSAITLSNPTYGQFIMSRHKVASLAVISNELMYLSDPRVDVIVRNAQVNQNALAEDLAFIRGTGSVNQPRGIYGWTASGNRYNSTGTTLAQVMADLVKAMRLVATGNAMGTNMAWVMHPRPYFYLYGLLDSNGHPVFQAELQQGRLLGYPVHLTTQIPITLTSTYTEVYFGNFDYVMIGEDEGMRVEGFPNGSYHDGSVVQSGISNDQTVIRSLHIVDLLLTQSAGFSVIEACDWGT